MSCFSKTNVQIQASLFLQTMVKWKNKRRVCQLAWTPSSHAETHIPANPERARLSAQLQ